MEVAGRVCDARSTGLGLGATVKLKAGRRCVPAAMSYRFVASTFDGRVFKGCVRYGLGGELVGRVLKWTHTGFINYGSYFFERHTWR